MKALKAISLTLLLLVTTTSKAQFLEPADSLNKKRLLGVSLGSGLAWSGSIAGLYFVWYKDFPKTGFHTFNDSREWQQMDKVGHMYSAWHFGSAVGDMFEWSGLDHKKASIIGAGYSIGYLTTFEFLDATNEQWGFSWSDVAFNSLGTATYWSQEYFWNKQYVHFKFSSHNSGLADYRPNVLGDNFASRMLKDYNGQTYWMSFNPVYWFKEESKIPEWINLSVGYSIEDQLIGDGSTFAYTSGSHQTFFTPYRQYYLSFDINFEAIPTDSKLLKLVFRGLNFFKLPFPAVEFANGGISVRPLYF